MADESFRKKDMRAESELAKFLDKNLYQKLKNQDGSHINFERKTDRNSQLQGIDVEIITENQTFYIDEKASFYYSNLMIPTFAFEIDSIQKGHDAPVEGWFVNDNLKTNHYLLIWPNVKCEESDGKWYRKSLDELSQSDFTIIEAMLINKKRLWREVERLGVSKERVSVYASAIREKMGKKKETHRESIVDGIKIMYSGKITEQPINVVIQKDILRRIASAIYYISEDGYAVIKREGEI